METLATMLLNCSHFTWTPSLYMSLHQHVIHVWPDLMWFRSHSELLGETLGTEWCTDQCAVRPKKGQSCSASRLPPEASWPRMMLGGKFAFWGSWKVADISSYIEDRSFITALSLSSPNSVFSLRCRFTLLSSIMVFFFPLLLLVVTQYTNYLFSNDNIIPHLLHLFLLTESFCCNNLLNGCGSVLSGKCTWVHLYTSE